MARNASKGKCQLCDKTYAKNGMTRHLNSCIKKTIEKNNETKSKKAVTKESLIVSVEGRYNPQYWLYLEMPVKTKLITLDGFLRDIWLECCSHLSAFKIAGEFFSIDPYNEFEDRDMNIPLIKVLALGEYCTYEYDFGSTTELTLKLIDVGTKVFPDNKITVLARNDEPHYRCDYCEGRAVEICMECYDEDKGWLCEKCLEEHTCDEEMWLPVVNSPRVGICAYMG